MQIDAVPLAFLLFNLFLCLLTAVDAEEVVLFDLHELVGELLRPVKEVLLTVVVVGHINQVAAHQLLEDCFPVGVAQGPPPQTSLLSRLFQLAGVLRGLPWQRRTQITYVP